MNFKVAETRIYDLGPYTIVQRPRPDNPYWARYSIYLGERFVGCQFSIPQISDCEFLKRQEIGRIVYAEASAKLYQFRLRGVAARRGRPSKADVAAREAAFLEAAT